MEFGLLDPKFCGFKGVIVCRMYHRQMQSPPYSSSPYRHVSPIVPCNRNSTRNLVESTSKYLSSWRTRGRLSWSLSDLSAYLQIPRRNRSRGHHHVVCWRPKRRSASSRSLSWRSCRCNRRLGFAHQDDTGTPYGPCKKEPILSPSSPLSKKSTRTHTTYTQTQRSAKQIFKQTIKQMLKTTTEHQHKTQSKRSNTNTHTHTMDNCVCIVFIPLVMLRVVRMLCVMYCVVELLLVVRCVACLVKCVCELR